MIDSYWMLLEFSLLGTGHLKPVGWFVFRGSML